MRRRFPLMGMGFLGASLDPVAAHAIGSCEGHSTRYKLISVAESAGLLAYEVEKDWCNEAESGDGAGEDAVLKALLVTDLQTRPKAAVPLAALGVVRVYLVTARCTGGPPPGMFDETGDCYATWARRYVDLLPKKVAGVEKCLPPA